MPTSKELSGFEFAYTRMEEEEKEEEEWRRVVDCFLTWS